MDLYTIRNQLTSGKSIFEIPPPVMTSGGCLCYSPNLHKLSGVDDLLCNVAEGGV